MTDDELREIIVSQAAEIHRLKIELTTLRLCQNPLCGHPECTHTKLEGCRVSLSDDWNVGDCGDCPCNEFVPKGAPVDRRAFGILPTDDPLTLIGTATV